MLEVDHYYCYYRLQRCADGGGGGAPNDVRFARKLVKSQPYCKGIRHSIFLLVKIVGQLVKHYPPPPNGKFLGTSLVIVIVIVMKKGLY